MKTLLIPTIMMLLSACSTPHINNINNKLEIIQTDKASIEVSGELIDENRVNLVNITVEQKVYSMDSGSILTYEDASVSIDYVFSYSMKRTVEIIFPNYSCELLGIKGNIHFFKLSNSKETNFMILENINKKRVKFIYGFSESLFHSLFESLVNDKIFLKETETNIKKSSVVQDTYIKSNWNSKNIILDTVIMKIGGRVRAGI